MMLWPQGHQRQQWMRVEYPRTCIMASPLQAASTPSAAMSTSTHNDNSRSQGARAPHRILNACWGSSCHLHQQHHGPPLKHLLNIHIHNDHKKA